MTEWKTAAEGVSIWDLESTVGEMHLPKGSKVRVVMNTWMSWAFDAAGAELVFKPFIPDGLKLIDVYGEAGKGIVDMEADPAWLLAVLAFIKAHWLAITIGGLLLSLIISLIIVMVKVPAVAAIPIALVVGAAMGVLGLMILGTRGRSP